MTDWTKYSNTVPREHQLEALNFIETNSRDYSGILLSMGTGKTLIYLSWAYKQFAEGKISAILWGAPKGAYGNFLSEIEKHTPKNLLIDVVQWVGQNEKKMQEFSQVLLKRDGRLKIFVFNVEAISSKKSRCLAFCQKFIKTHKTSFAIDEASCIKNMSSIRTEMALKLAANADYRHAITGSAITESPIDLWGICSFMHPQALGFTSYFAFRGTFCDMNKEKIYVKGEERTINSISGFKRLDKLRQKLDRFCFIRTKEQCLDLPPKIYVTRSVEMPEEQRKIYEEFKKNLIIEIEEGTASATIVLSKLTKLQQISNGYIKLDDGSIKYLPNGRLEVLFEILEEIGNESKVIIWAPFRPLISILEKAISDKYGKDSLVTFFGDTNIEDRIANVKRFQEDPKCRYFIGNPSVGGYSITLTAAHDVIYYSNNYSADQRWQSEDRAHRIGQEQSVTYIDLLCENSLDSRVLKILQSKKDIASMVLGDKSTALELLA